MSPNSSRVSGHWTTPPRAIAAGGHAGEACARRTGSRRYSGTRPEIALNSVVLPAPFSPTIETNSPSRTCRPTLLERLRLAVEDADARRPRADRLAFAAASRPLASSFDLAAEIDAAHGLVAHHLLGGAFGDVLAEIHREHAIDQRRHALDVVIDQQHGAAFLAEAADQVGERADLGAGEAGERLVDQHDLRVARDRLGHLHAAADRRTARCRDGGACTAPSPTRSAIARARPSTPGAAASRSS